MAEEFLRRSIVEAVAFLDIDGVIPYCDVNLSYNLLVYWKPWSLCKSIDLSLSVHIFANAFCSVSATSFKSLFLLIQYPLVELSNKTLTTDRNMFPLSVVILP